jgi:hypothetical protein
MGPLMSAGLCIERQNGFSHRWGYLAIVGGKKKSDSMKWHCRGNGRETNWYIEYFGDVLLSLKCCPTHGARMLQLEPLQWENRLLGLCTAVCVCVCVFFSFISVWKVDGMVTDFGLYHKHLPYVFKDKTTPHVEWAQFITFNLQENIYAEHV